MRRILRMGMRRILRMGTGSLDPMRRILRMGLTCGNRVIHNGRFRVGTPMRRILRMGLSCGNGVIHRTWVVVVGGSVNALRFPFQDVQIPGLATVRSPLTFDRQVAGDLQLGKVGVN